MLKTWVPENRKHVLDTALFYCARRETSRPKLKLYLTRKFINQKTSEEKNAEIALWIEDVIQELERLNVIDHSRFADILTREYGRRGKGRRYVEQKLKEKGLTEEIKNVEFTEEDQLAKAHDLALKTMRRSSVQKIEDPYALKQKLLQRLVSHGFDFSVAKKAVELALKGE